MKKIAIIVFLAVFSVVIITGCSKKESYVESPQSHPLIYEQTEVQALVVKSEQGDLHPDSSSNGMASYYLGQGDFGKWIMYSAVAKSKGTYDYNVTVNINGDHHTVIRDTPYILGQYITVTSIKAYNENSELVFTRYL